MVLAEVCTLRVLLVTIIVIIIIIIIITTSAKTKFCGGYAFSSIGLSVYPSICMVAGLLKSYERILMKFSGKIEDGTSNKPLNFGSDVWPVCLSLLAYYSKTYEWISMKYSGKIEDDTSNKP